MAAVVVAVDEAEGKYNGVPQLVTTTANRHVRAVMASAFADLAAKQMNPAPGFNAIEWWKAIYRLLRRFTDNYQNKPESCIGMAKADELFQMCEYYRKTLSLEQLKTPGVIKRRYGQLIVNLLECESCWKLMLNNNNLTLNSGRIKKQFSELLKRYVPLESDSMDMLTECVLAYMCKGGVITAGGTNENALSFNKLFAKGENYV